MFIPTSNETILIRNILSLMGYNEHNQQLNINYPTVHFTRALAVVSEGKEQVWIFGGGCWALLLRSKHHKGLILAQMDFKHQSSELQRQTKSCHRAKYPKPLTCISGGGGRKVTTLEENSSVRHSRDRSDYRLLCSQMLAKQGPLLADHPSTWPGCLWYRLPLPA